MLGDTIVARASAAGGSERAVLRLSGPGALALATRVFTPLAATPASFATPPTAANAANAAPPETHATAANAANAAPLETHANAGNAAPPETTATDAAPAGTGAGGGAAECASTAGGAGPVTLPGERATVEGHVRVLGRAVPAFALVMPAPRSFTGEDVVELHVPGGALLVQHVLDALLADGAAAGVRLALPGEFTARAAQHGRLAASAVEGLLLLLHAADARAAAVGVHWLRGGALVDVAAVRAQLQDALALLEAGLDFGDGETGAVDAALWRAPLQHACERLVALASALPAANPGGEVLLLGAANAGKSSLANALAGRDLALVDAAPGTTRDLLRIELPADADAPTAARDPRRVVSFAGDVAVAEGTAGTGDTTAARDPQHVVPFAGDFAAAEGTAGADAAATHGAVARGRVVLWDAPGDRAEAGADADALALRARLGGAAAAALLVLDASAPVVPPAALATTLPWLGVVWTKTDLAPAPPLPPAVAALSADTVPTFATSARSGAGIAALRAWLAARAPGGVVDAGAPLRAALLSAHAALVRSTAGDTSPELAAVDVQAALRALDGLGGDHSPEALLDRIYARFCLGK